MKKTLSLLCLAVLTATAGPAAAKKSPFKGIDPAIAAAAQKNIEAAGANGPELLKAITESPKKQREGMAFVVAYMPAGDRDTLTAAFLLEEVSWAYKARETFPWVKGLPDSIFYNEVLPYASFNETREPWRAMFWEMLYPVVKDIKDERAALDTINKAIAKLTGVEYNTKRRKANQSPSESISQGMASCTGLSILLTDALRTVGIPSRVAGTPMWVTMEGNHNWSEVWLDGQWHFIEYYPTPALDRSWFLERAGKADKTKPMHWIYAMSWKTTGLDFPWGWGRGRGGNSLPAHDVTDRYISLYNAQMAESAKGVRTAIRAYSAGAADRSSASRAAVDIRVVDDANKMVAAGTTAGPTADMNDYLVLYLPEGKTLTLLYKDSAGADQSVSVNTAAAQDIELVY